MEAFEPRIGCGIFNAYLWLLYLHELCAASITQAQTEKRRAGLSREARCEVILLVSFVDSNASLGISLYHQVAWNKLTPQTE